MDARICRDREHCGRAWIRGGDMHAYYQRERGGEGGGFNFFMVLVRSEASCEEIKRGEIDNLSKF